MYYKRSNSLWHYLGRSNAVDKADLLETFFAHGEADFPALVDNFMDHSEGIANLVHLVFQIHVHVATEICNLEYKSDCFNHRIYSPAGLWIISKTLKKVKTQ